MGCVATLLVSSAWRPPWYKTWGAPYAKNIEEALRVRVVNQHRDLCPVIQACMRLIEIDLTSATSAVTLNRPRHKVAGCTRASKTSGLVAAAFLRSDKEHNVGDGGDFGQTVLRSVGEGIANILDERKNLVGFTGKSLECRSSLLSFRDQVS